MTLEARAVYHLDAFRCAILRFTMRSAIARRLFIDRQTRLVVLHSVWLVIAIALSSLFPLWILLLGPIIYGFPHLASSMRYFAVAPLRLKGDALTRRRIYLAIGLLATAVGILRLLATFDSDLNLIRWLGVNYLEVVFALCIATSTILISGNRRGAAFVKLIVLAPLVMASYFDPMITVGALILVHNFVGYFYWIGFAKQSDGLSAAAISALLFCAFNLVLFWGGFDAALQILPSMLELKLANLSVLPLGAAILPWSHDPSIWHRAVVAYAFGQTMHYFVWLKAIPEQNLFRPAPVTFRQSWRLLQLDFGMKGARFLVAAVLALTLIWLVFSLPTARNIYFSLAGFHGYLEIAGLAFLLQRSNWSNKSPCTA